MTNNIIQALNHNLKKKKNFKVVFIVVVVVVIIGLFLCTVSLFQLNLLNQ